MFHKLTSRWPVAYFCVTPVMLEVIHSFINSVIAYICKVPLLGNLFRGAPDKAHQAKVEKNSLKMARRGGISGEC